MNPKPTNPHRQPETEFMGELQEFSGPALSPDDPGLEPRLRRGRPGDRKARLFACRCVREIERLLIDPRSLRAVDVAERFANGLETQDELRQAAKQAAEAAGVIAENCSGEGRALAAEAACWTAAETAAEAESEAPKLAARAEASEATAAVGLKTMEALEAAERKATQRQAKIRADIYSQEPSRP